jgi:hypothetical protein
MYFNITIFLFLFGSAFSQAPYTNKYLRNVDVPILKNNSIINYNNSQIPRKLNRRRRIGKIVGTGLKIAIIAKTGGVAALKSAAAKKLKEIAVRKGIQCLKNGFSNFCNGKKKVKTITKRLRTKRTPTSIVSKNKKNNKMMINSPTIKRKPVKKINRKKIKPTNSTRTTRTTPKSTVRIRKQKPTKKTRFPLTKNKITKSKPTLAKLIRRRTGSPTGSPIATWVVLTTRPSRRIRRRSGSPTGSPSATEIVRTMRPYRRTSSPTRIPRATGIIQTMCPSRRTSSPTGSPSDIGNVITTQPTRLPSSNNIISSTKKTFHPQSNRLSTRTPTQTPSRIPTTSPTIRPTRPPTQQPTQPPTRRPTQLPTQLPSWLPTCLPTQTPTQLNWNAMFSSSPTPVNKIPPTSVPTNTMFTIISSSLTKQPTSIKTNSPTAIYTKTPTRTPSQMPSRIPTTQTPSIQPTQIPTSNVPTIDPTTITNGPTTVLNSLSTNSISTSQPSMSTTNIIISIIVLVIFIILIAMTVYFLKKKQIKLDPYQLWINYYDKKTTTNIEDDIHHFYRKSNRLPEPIVMSKLSHQINSV